MRERSIAEMSVQKREAIEREEVTGGVAWTLRTRRTAMVLHAPAGGPLYLAHWGGNGGDARPSDFPLAIEGQRRSESAFLDGRPLAYPVHGDATFKEPCLVVARADGGREARFGFEGDRAQQRDGVPTLELAYVDPSLGLRLVHRFRVFPERDLIARSVTIINEGDTDVTLERALSAALPLPPGDYEAWTLHGQWAGEFGLHRRALGPGKLVIEGRRGPSGHEAHPWFAVSPLGETTEKAGPVWFGSLAWSGVWAAVFEVERAGTLHMAVGVQPFDFGWRLGPGERFATPEIVCGYSEEGLGGAARLLHAYEETVALPAAHRNTPRPVLYNSWEATYFDVTATGQAELARVAAGLGVELFVVDDGWFGERDSERAGLGDWRVNPRKFPHGLRPLIDEVHALGMRFGIWVEPEMVSPDSDLYRAHPDWAFAAAGREPVLGREQLVLNFARADVRANILAQLRALLTEHGRIDFIKWDHNRPWTDVGWPEHPERGREAWVRHVYGLYEVLAALRVEFPDLLIESCASGGGRADLGMVAVTDQAWTSDNTDAADRLTIQYGYSRAHTPRTMVNWVTDVPNHQTGRVAPLEFRFHVAMQGVLGLGGHIARWSAEERETARALIAAYKEIRPLVQFGRQYWPLPPAATGPCAVQYVSPSRDETVLFIYQVRGVRGTGARRVRMQGLDSARRYRRDGDGIESTGAALMAAGVPAAVVDPAARFQSLDLQSAVQVWRAVE